MNYYKKIKLSQIEPTNIPTVEDIEEKPVDRRNTGTVAIEVSKMYGKSGILYLKDTKEDKGIEVSPEDFYNLISRKWVKSKADEQVKLHKIQHFDNGGSVILPMDINKWEIFKSEYVQEPTTSWFS